MFRIFDRLVVRAFGIFILIVNIFLNDSGSLSLIDMQINCQVLIFYLNERVDLCVRYKVHYLLHGLPFSVIKRRLDY